MILRGDILNKLFYCYSPILKKELLENGFRYLHSGIHNTTKKTFWVFENNNEFDKYFKNRKKY